MLVLILIGGAVLGWFLLRSPDPHYELGEFLFPRHFHRFDGLIQEYSNKRNLDPTLVKALIWQESHFYPSTLGSADERGLMQVTLPAADEWAKEERGGKFLPNDLLDPSTNIAAGTWLLARRLKQYENRDDPVPFALADYNAGRSRVQRWISRAAKDAKAESSDGVTSKELLHQMSFPATQKYIREIQERQRFYQQRGKL